MATTTVAALLLPVAPAAESNSEYQDSTFNSGPVFN